MFRKRAEQIMLERKGISSRQEIALRIADALDAVLPYSKSGTKRKLRLSHRILHLDLPRADPSRKPPYPIDGGGTFRFHVMRVGDVALVSAPAEMCWLKRSLRPSTRFFNRGWRGLSCPPDSRWRNRINGTIRR